MSAAQVTPPRVLIIYYSFSSQTRNLLHSLAAGLEIEGVTVDWEQLRMQDPLRFPFGSIPRTIHMMLATFFRKRFPIHPLSETAFAGHDLIILAGPTWSYNPSGPVLSLFDRDGERLFAGNRVLPLISCRGYWRMHWWGLRHLLRRCRARVVNLIVFTHPSPEPWRTIGVFLKLAGKIPERMWFGKYYRKYGHTNAQLLEAERFGLMIGRALKHGSDLAHLDFSCARARR